jgi:hypothetical protein
MPVGYKIDWNRGVTESNNVHMYKDSPGVYYGPHGDEVDEATAKAAGFPVDEQVRERERRKRLAEADARIRRDLEYERLRLYGEDNPPFVVVDKGNGYWTVAHKDETDVSVFTAAERGKQGKAEAQAKAVELSEALWRRMAGFTDEEIEALATPAVSAPSAGGGPVTGGGGSAGGGNG